MIILDSAYKKIVSEIAMHTPERGGALYGPRSYPLVTHFEYDAQGDTSSASYTPSAQLIQNVEKMEKEIGLQFKGIIHSHPRGIIHPSRGDEQTIISFFQTNPHISEVALPIVQQTGKTGQDDENSFLYWYRAERRGRVHNGNTSMYWANSFDISIQVLKEDFFVIPLVDHVEKILDKLEKVGFRLKANKKVQPIRIQNAEVFGIMASSNDGHEFLYSVSIDYPIVAPLVLHTKNKQFVAACFSWDGISNIDGSLECVAKELEDAWADSRQNSSAVPDIKAPDQEHKIEKPCHSVGRMLSKICNIMKVK